MTQNSSFILKLCFSIFLIILNSNLHSQESSGTNSSNTKSSEFTLVVEELRGNVNTKFQEFSPSLSPNGNTLYFYSKRDKGSYTDIFSSQRKPDGTWDFPQEVKEINSEFDDQSPFITHDGKYLFFSSNRDGSYETRLPNGKVGVSRDIYYAEWNKGKWGEVRTLPMEINTDMIEENPHFHNGVLLFSRYPFGRPDLAKIYMSIYDEKKGWGKAVIIPKPVNDAYATIAAAFSHDGKTIFFASNRPGGFGGFDLYSMNWKDNAPEGSVENLGPDFNTKGDEAYFSYHRDTKTILFARREEGKNFNLYSAYIPKEETIEEQLDDKKKISLDSIHFATASYDLLPESKRPLKYILDFLKKRKEVKMKIIGHTDLNGNLEDNMQLSHNRAKTVKKYLIENGIDESRLTTDGMGPKEPLFPTKDEAASKKNRRTEFQITN
jgi:outer membrane protein OmpA-like peptidoglycan-associated protein